MIHMTRPRFALTSLLFAFGCAAIEDETGSTSVVGDDTAEDDAVSASPPSDIPDLPPIVANKAFGVVALDTHGDLVDAFGGDGIVGTNFAGFNAAVGTAIAPDGTDVILGGFVSDGTTLHWALSKYTSTGALDTSFDGDGRRVTPWAGATSATLNDLKVSGGFIYAVGTVTVDGHLRLGVAKYSATTGATITAAYVSFPQMTEARGENIEVVGSDIFVSGVVGFAGQSRANVGLAKLRTSDLTLVASFGTSGRVINSLGDTEYLGGMAMDGSKIVLGGSAIDGDDGRKMWVARYTSAGDLDPTFSGNGSTMINFSGPHEDIDDLTVSDGKITAVGSSAPAGEDVRMAVVRLNSNGSLDTSCDGNGLKEISFAGRSAWARGVSTSGTRIRIAGTLDLSTSGTADIASVQLMPDDCALDTGFDGDGRRTVNVTGHDEGNAIVISNARVYIGGSR